jgi:hypothetical protein
MAPQTTNGEKAQPWKAIWPVPADKSGNTTVHGYPAGAIFMASGDTVAALNPPEVTKTLGDGTTSEKEEESGEATDS